MARKKEVSVSPVAPNTAIEVERLARSETALYASRIETVLRAFGDVTHTRGTGLWLVPLLSLERARELSGKLAKAGFHVTLNSGHTSKAIVLAKKHTIAPRLPRRRSKAWKKLRHAALQDEAQFHVDALKVIRAEQRKLRHEFIAT
jgi:hypothetical protein